ncbi:MAG: histidine kinase, partial [Ferruginibacter sp.]
RHSLFWGCWILYFTVLTVLGYQGKFPLSKSFVPSLVETIISTPMDMLFCYSILYFLFPRFLFKGKYISMVLLWILFSCLFVVVFILYSKNLLPQIRQFYGMPKPGMSSNYVWVFFNLFSQINMEFGLAAAIKLGKMWFIKSEELLLVQQKQTAFADEKNSNNVPPFFLMNALDRVDQFSQSNPSIVPAMMTRIKKLLFYNNYYQQQTNVQLSDELHQLQEYIELEKTGAGTALSATVTISGEAGSQKIAPSIILPLGEFCFRQMTAFDQPEKHIFFEIQIVGQNMTMLVAWNKPGDTSALMTSNNGFLQTISKRLKILYPGTHSFTALIKPEQFQVKLSIDFNYAVI